MKNSDFFETEIQMIESIELQDFVRFFFNERVGAWFWSSGASASGKFHPEFTKGEGGLVRHTKSVARMCEELLRLNTYAYMKDEYKDFARVACLLHDTRKYGAGNEMDKNCYKEHGALAANDVAIAYKEFFNKECPEYLLSAIRSHMGQWVTNKEDRPFTNIDRLVHMSDYIMSRPMLDCPDVTKDYNDTINLPFQVGFSFALNRLNAIKLSTVSDPNFHILPVQEKFTSVIRTKTCARKS